jgi:hypothetical protein
MAKGERNVNPATAALKASKKAGIKKQKTQLAQQRAEKLSRRNPDRLQRQIDDLNQVKERSGGVLRPKDKETLEQLERDVRAIRKAREMLGDKAPQFKERQGGYRDGGNSGDGVLGKRRRDEGSGARRPTRDGDSSDTDADIGDMPMPKDVENMPPVPRRQHNRTNNNSNPTGGPHALPSKPGDAPAAPTPAQSVYSAAPQIRDLKKEAVSRFVPAAVVNKIRAAKGEGRLLEPEEADALEKQGYTGVLATAEKAAEEEKNEIEYRLMAREQQEGPAGTLEEEELRFQEELNAVQRPDAIEQDIEHIADEAEHEAEFRLMAREHEEGQADAAAQSTRARQELRHVEMEEVQDEDS